jgi:hypothetical protein
VRVQTRRCAVNSCAANQGVMKVHFPEEHPEYRARDFVVAFPAEVDVARVQCAITARRSKTISVLLRYAKTI